MKKKISKKQVLNKKLKEYGKILQKDEDWDWLRTRKCISSNNIIKDASKVARQK